MEKSETKQLTLCDGCILIVVFGIAAAVFSPRISRALERNQLSSLVDRLHIIRSRIKLYRADHDGLLPGQRFIGDSVTSGEFIEALQQQRSDGSAPYLRILPGNPYIDDFDRNKTITCVNDTEAMPEGNEQTAWWFNAATGDFYACDRKFHTHY